MSTAKRPAKLKSGEFVPTLADFKGALLGSRWQHGRGQSATVLVKIPAAEGGSDWADFELIEKGTTGTGHVASDHLALHYKGPWKKLDALERVVQPLRRRWDDESTLRCERCGFEEPSDDFFRHVSRPGQPLFENMELACVNCLAIPHKINGPCHFCGSRSCHWTTHRWIDPASGEYPEGESYVNQLNQNVTPPEHFVGAVLACNYCAAAIALEAHGVKRQKQEPELQAEPAPNEEETMPTAADETETQASASGFYKVGDKVRVKPEGWAFGEVTAVGAEGVTVAYRVKKVDHSGVFTPAQLKLKDGAEHERRTRLDVDEMVADTPSAAPKAPPRWSDIVKPVDEDPAEDKTGGKTGPRPAPVHASNGKHEPADEQEGQSIDETETLKLTGFGHLLATAEGMTVENLGNLIGALGSLLAAKCSAGKAELSARARRRDKAAENGQPEQHFPLDVFLPDGERQPLAEPCSCRGQLAGPSAVHGPDSCSKNGGTGLSEPAQDETWDGESVDEHGAPVDSEGQQIGPEDLMAQGYLCADSSDLGEDLRPLTLGEVTEEMANELPAATQLYFTTPLGFAWRFVISVIDGEKRLWVGYSQPASEGEEGSETKPTSWSKFTEHIGEAVFTLTINGLELRDKALEAFPEWAHANVILPWTAVRDGQRIAGVKSTKAAPAELDDDWQPEGPLAVRLAAKATEEAPEPDGEDLPMPALRVLQPGVTRIGDLTEDEINLLAADGLEALNLVLRDPDGGIWWAWVDGSSQRPGGPVVPTNWIADFQPPPLPDGKVVKVKPDPRCVAERSWNSTAEFRTANAEQLVELASDYWFNDHAVVIPDVLLPFVPVEVLDALALAMAEEEERERLAELERQQQAKLDGEPLPRGCCYGHVSVEQLDGLLEGRARLHASGHLGRDNTKWMIWAGESCYLAGKKTIKKEKLRRWLKCGGDEALSSAEFRAKFYGYTVRIEKADGVSITPPRWATNCLVKHGAKVKRADLPFPEDEATEAKAAARR